jgi:uncharacterized protein
MLQSRRYFSFSASLLASAALNSQLAHAQNALKAPAGAGNQGLDGTQEWLIGGAQFALPSSPGVQKRAISLMSLADRQAKLIDLDFFPHGFAIDPTQPSRVASFQKIGPGAAIVDLATGRLVQRIAKHRDQQFYGHGAFTPDGKTLLSTERDEQAQRGLIAIRDGRTLAYLGEFPSYGDSPHDCHLIDAGKTLVVANGDGSVAYIDLNSQKLLEKLLIPNPKFNAGHLLPLPQRKIIAVSAPTKGLSEQALGGISLRLAKASWLSLEQPLELTSKMVGEALSIAASQKHQVFGVTHPSANLISFWSLVDGKPLASLTMPRPRGIEVSVDETKFLLSYGQHAGLAIVDAKSLIATEQSTATAYFSGSHILNWSRVKLAGS